jgi:hypothetical protein
MATLNTADFTHPDWQNVLTLRLYASIARNMTKIVKGGSGVIRGTPTKATGTDMYSSELIQDVCTDVFTIPHPLGPGEIRRYNCQVKVSTHQMTAACLKKGESQLLQTRAALIGRVIDELSAELTKTLDSQIRISHNNCLDETTFEISVYIGFEKNR